MGRSARIARTNQGVLFLCSDAWGRMPETDEQEHPCPGLRMLEWEVKFVNACNCHCKCPCALAAGIAGLIIGIIGAFLQITGVITATPVFLWVVFGIAVVYLGLLVPVAALVGAKGESGCLCPALQAVLLGALGSILLAVILLAVGVVTTSVVSAILVGLLLFFFTLVLGGTACLVKSLFGCGN